MKTTNNMQSSMGQMSPPWLFSAIAALGLMATPSRAEFPIIEVPPTDQIAPANFTATFGVFASGALGYLWYFNNHLIPGATNHLLNIFDAQAANQGSYVVVATNATGATTNPPVTLAITNIPTQAPSVQFNTLASFSEYLDGGFPQAGVIQASDGYLYGTTLTGGTNAGGANGTVFKMTTNGTFVWTFVFNNANGQTPAAGLVQARDGNLYGATVNGGQYGYGALFRMTTNAVISNLYNFDVASPTNGAYPQAALCVGSDGYLYGTTTTNGTGSPGGTIFKMSTNGGNPVWSFPLTSSTGCVPLAGLVQGSDGVLYGTTSQGGAGSNGTIFRISTNGADFFSLYSFTGGADGGYPIGGLVQGPDAQLYGTTSAGGNANVNLGQGYGSIFKITTDGAFTLLLDFDGTNGGSPEASLMVAGDGNLYGTANTGGIGSLFGSNNLFTPIYGTIFQLTTNGTLTTLLSLDGNYGGDAPHSTLWQGRDGGLYGTTSQGGTNDLSLNGQYFGDGTVFRLGVVPPAIQTATVSGGIFSFTWNAMPGELYQAQYKDTLNQPSWINFGNLVAGTNGLAGQSDIITATTKARFYRALLQF
jgi:uncharacterized repeat protein (TIGR03803 family)